VRDVMSPEVLSLGPRATLLEATGLMVRNKVGAVPVLDGPRLVGILTHSDVLARYERLSAEA
jgi:CBS domain-containing protein